MTEANPKTLLEAVRYFSDLSVCNDYMRKIKWPDGKVTCPRCGGNRIGEIATRSMLRCKDCRKQFSYKVGTIFEDSPLGLDKWFVAVWCIANAKNGISSHELGRALGVTQKTAWFMLHRIRKAMLQRLKELGSSAISLEYFQRPHYCRSEPSRCKHDRSPSCTTNRYFTSPGSPVTRLRGTHWTAINRTNVAS